jgi:hypothetical protein
VLRGLGGRRADRLGPALTDDDDLTATVARLLSEPRPRRLARPQPDREFSGTPLGRAQAMRCLAGDLVAEADYVGALPDWEDRYARLSGLWDELSAGMVVGVRRETLAAEVEGLRLRGRYRGKHTERLHLELAAALRRGSEIAQQAATTVAGLGRADEIGYLMASRITSTICATPTRPVRK